MRVALFHRHFGLHTLRKEIEVAGALEHYAKDKGVEDYEVNEPRLLAALPKDFLPCSPENILLAVNDTGQRGLKIFLNWAKYFDAYCIFLSPNTEQKGEGK